MRVVSWNVNGIRACVRRGFVDFLDRSGADILGVQEVRALPEEIPSAARTPTDWHAAFAVAERRGYSGVGIYSKFRARSSGDLSRRASVRYRGPVHRCPLPDRSRALRGCKRLFSQGKREGPRQQPGRLQTRLLSRC